jgi:hypothetical protein
VTAALEVHESHDRNEISDVQAWRARIEAAVGRDRPRGEGLPESFGVLKEEPAPRELIEHLFVI